jgi:hypothetical protein
MPQPTPGDVHVNFILTNLSVAYAQQSNFIADQVFPQIPVANQSNRYWKYPRGSWFRTEVRKRAPGTQTPGSGWELSDDSYFCDTWGVHKDIDDQTRANTDNGIVLDSDATNFVTGQMLLKRDLEWQAAYFQPGVWTTNLTGVTAAPAANQFVQWDQAASTPLQDVLTQQIAMSKITGVTPNVMVMGPEVQVALYNHPQILDRIKYTQTGVITIDLLARFFNVDRILIASAVINTTPEAAPQDTMPEGPIGVGVNYDDDTTGFDFVFGKDMLLCYSNPNPGLRSVSAGYVFTWTGLFGTGAYGGRIKSFRMEEIASDRVEGEQAYDLKMIAPDLGIFWNGLVA